MKCFVAMLLVVALAGDAWAQQQMSWRDLALRTQQNAAADMLIANGMLTALQVEIAELKTTCQLPPSTGGEAPAKPGEDKPR
jgi:hypothetical protein